MDPQRVQRPRFQDFPYASDPIRDLMIEMLSTVEKRLESQLNPYTVPPDVEYYQNENGTNHGSTFVLAGAPSSPIDIVYGSWVHISQPPTEVNDLHIATLFIHMKDSTDIPPFFMELMQGSPTTAVILVDLPPRRDPVIHPRYLESLYGEMGLAGLRRALDSVLEAQPYESPSLYIQASFSPAAILTRLDATQHSKGGEARLEEIVRDEMGPVAKKVLETWLELVSAGAGRLDLEEDDKECLRKRDAMFRSKIIEIDLETTLPRLFGEDVASRVITQIKGLMGVRV